jgi:fructose/tagatose bisphosphate aldolase
MRLTGAFAFRYNIFYAIPNRITKMMRNVNVTTAAEIGCCGGRQMSA